VKFRDDVFLGIALISSLISTYFALFIVPSDVDMGELVKVFYFHLPPALICYLTLTISMATAIWYLRKRDIRYDALSESAALLGLIYGLITLIGGAIWANATWGVYWNWDPRETATLILWLAYIGYFLLRFSVENPERRASVSAVYNILSFLTVPLSYLSFLLWPSLHPRIGTEEGLGLTGAMTQALILNILSGLILYAWFLRKAYGLRMKKDELAEKLSEQFRYAN